MPFISKDWRSPGDYWVKSGSGWERFKVLQFVGGSNESGSRQDEQQQNQQQPQPHCKINLRQTREISGFNTLSEALQLLDFQNALRDQRKFQYICVIIRLLISNPLLGGNSQRILVKLLFQICDQVRIGWRYDLLRAILNDMRKSLDYCWGGNLGSALLWNENKLQIDKIEDLMATYKDEAPRIPLQDFPEDIIRLVILKLSSDKDLRNFAEADDTLKSLVSENRIWRQLCIYHFSRENIINTAIKLQQQQQQQQANKTNTTNTNNYCNYNINFNGALNNHNHTASNFINNNNCSSNLINNNGSGSPPLRNNSNQNHGNNHNLQEENKENENDENKSGSGGPTGTGSVEVLDWENVYKYLKRNFNLKEEYAEVLNYCKPCNVLFWPSCGHPCIVGTSVFLENDDATGTGNKGKDQSNFLVDVRPCDFVSFFST